ncbi:MAG: hypothetical protein H6509_06555 [Bryobacterales bacterium]|nr:hypothetical protein [Bryobacterales bacterium]
MSRFFVVFLVGISTAFPAWAQQVATPPCTLEVASYTSSAQRVPARIKSLGAARLPGNLLDPKDELRTALGRDALGKLYFDIVVKGETVFFPRELADRWAPLRIVVGTEAGNAATTTVLLTHCRQRVSLFVNVDQLQEDSLFVSFIKGKLVGCRLAGDWWLRGAPLFQGNVYAYLEGDLDASDGAFWIQAVEPVRHILIFGRGQEPLFTTAVDVSLTASGMAQDMDLGAVDIGSSCPPELREP